MTDLAALERANALVDFRRYPEAIAELRLGIAEHPDSAALLTRLATLEYHHGDTAAAGVAASQALALDPDDAFATFILSSVARDRGDLDRALQLAEHLVARHPDWPVVHIHRAWVLIRFRAARRRADEIRAGIARTIELDPDEADHHRLAAYLYGQLGDNASARAAVANGLALDPNNEQLLLQRIEFENDSAEEIAAILTGMLATNPQQRDAARILSAGVWVRMAVILTASGVFTAILITVVYLFYPFEILGAGRDNRAFGMLLLAIPIGWISIAYSLRSTLPRGYLRRMLRPVPWVWLGLGLSFVATIVTALVAMAIAVSAGSTAEWTAEHVADEMTALLSCALVVSVVAELLIAFARHRSERVNRLYSDADDVHPARAMLAVGGKSLMVRGAFGAALVTVAITAHDVATQPGSQLAVLTAALAIVVAPIVGGLLAAAQLQRVPAAPATPARRGARTALVAAIIAAVLGVGALVALCDAQLAAIPS